LKRFIIASNRLFHHDLRMHLRAFLKALLFVRLAIGVAWSAEVPPANTPADAPNVGEIFRHTVGQVDLLTKAREAAGRPGGPVEVFFRRLRVEPSFRATVKAKAFTQDNGGPVAVTLLLVRDDEREVLVHTGEASGNELKLTEHLKLGQSYRFPHVCAAAGVPMNPDAKETPAGVPAVMTLFENLTQLQALPLASGMLHDFTSASPPHEPHFLASSLRRCPPFRGTLVRKASLKLEDGKVAVSVAFYRPDALPMTITEVGAAPETQRFVDFLKEGESYDFPAILDKVDGVQFPPAAPGSKSERPELFHQIFRQPGWSTQSEEFLRARAPDGTLPTPLSPGAAPFIPTTPEEKALDRYVGAWGAAIQESASGEFLKGKLGAMITLRRWTMDGKQLRLPGRICVQVRANLPQATIMFARALWVCITSTPPRAISVPSIFDPKPATNLSAS
jgi:hypothetical protein